MMREFEKIDYTLFSVCMALTLFGFIMVYSASSVLGFESEGDGAYYVKKQIMWGIAAVLAGMFLYRMKEEQLRKIIPAFMIVSVICLYLVLVKGLGVKLNGAVRWLKLPLLPSFQPFELVKLSYVLYLASVLSDEALPMQKKLTRIGLVTGAICFAMLKQPDLGGTVIIVGILFFMLFITGISLLYFTPLLGLAAVAVVYLIKAEPYRLKRVFAFLDPWADPFGAGFQTIQSFIAIGSGGIFGLGLSQSQQKLLYLPAPHSDFIFSIIGEELGFIGAVMVLGAFGVILWRGITIALGVDSHFHKYLAAGLTAMITIQACTNIAVVTGLMPPKGTTLPFISSGGSSLAISLIAVTLLLSISTKVYGGGRR